MAAGKIVSGQCLDASAALDIYISHSQPVITAGSPSYTSWLYRDGASTLAKVTYRDGVYFSNETYSGFTLPACDTTTQFLDGVTLGWLVVAAMAAAWGITVLKRAVS